MMRPGFLSSADRVELKAFVRRQREDHGIARRANAIPLLDDGQILPGDFGFPLSGQRHRPGLYFDYCRSRIWCLDGWVWNDSVKPMIRAGFLSSEERLELEACVRRQREDHGIARRANAILLLDDGKSCQEIELPPENRTVTEATI